MKIENTVSSLNRKGKYQLPQSVEKWIVEQLRLQSPDGIREDTVLSDGKSGATVHRIYVDSTRKRNNGNYIVKLIDKHSPWYDSSCNEGTKGSEIREHAGEFGVRLVKVVAYKEIDDLFVVIYEQANRSVRNTTSLDKLRCSVACDVIERLSEELLSQWNPSPSTEVDGRGFFTSLLDYRIEKDGSFWDKLSRSLKYPDRKAFLYRGIIYPNPAYFLSWWDRTQPDKNANFLRGNVHGDLHRRNVMCSKLEQGVPEYFLIDYDSFEKNNYLLYDQAYLELSIYFDDTMSYDIVRWIECMHSVLDKDIDAEIANEIDEPVRALRNAVCRGIVAWREKAMPGVTDTIETQFLLARIAAGINYFSKKAIQNVEQLQRILIFIGICIEKFFRHIGEEFFPDNEDVTDFVDSIRGSERAGEIYDHWIDYANSRYISVLITDDCYRVEEYASLESLARIKWTLVMDIGENSSPNDIGTHLSKRLSEVYRIHHFNVLSDGNRVDYTPSSCLWLTAKKDDSFATYRLLWKHCKGSVSHALQQILDYNPLKPLLILLDVEKASLIADEIATLVFDHSDQLHGTRFIELRKSNLSSEDFDATISEVQMHHDVLQDATLVDCALATKLYIASPKYTGHCLGAYLPTIDALPPVRLTEKELQYYGSSVELVYSGIETLVSNTDYGLSFYKGGEITWQDLANDVDIRLLNNYDDELKKLLEVIENDSPRIKYLKLIHGSGTGGTTLAKRLLWDLKDCIPCLRLIRYTKDTVNILLDIYGKTKKRLFLAIEMGSSVINTDQLNELTGDVNARNGRLLVLRIEREGEPEIEATDTDVIFHLRNRLEDNVARKFCAEFLSKTFDFERKEYIKNITTREDYPWIEQRCPFFYGFYTYQEEYDLEHILNAVHICNSNDKELLSDLSLVTLYSQNVSVAYEEVMRHKGYLPATVSYAMLYEQTNPSVRKFIVETDAGWRICHPLIAKKMLESIYGEDFSHAVYEAALKFLERRQNFFGKQSERVDAVLRELFIDRAYFDSERNRFSQLVEDIRKDSQRQDIFQRLIDYYPENTHYYNHMGRLLSGQSLDNRNVDYKKAAEYLEKAISIAKQHNENPSSHYVTLGVIYGKKLLAYIREVGDNARNGRFIPKMDDLLAEIQNDYLSADSAFKSARHFSTRKNSYLYYPNILMETGLIERLVQSDAYGRNLEEMCNQEKSFKQWYITHYEKVVWCLFDMQRHFEPYDTNYRGFLERAETKINGISTVRFPHIEKDYNAWMEKDGEEAVRQRRMYASVIYAHQGFRWEAIRPPLLSAIERGMRKNILHAPAKVKQSSDAYYWYQAYRRLPEFDASEVIRIFEEYCDQDYQKEYILYLMHFIKLLKGLSSAKDVMKHIHLCRNLLPAGINDILPRDVYLEDWRALGSPIISHNEFSLGKMNWENLKRFTGTIKTAHQGSSVGRIQINKINLMADFNLSIKDDTGERKRNFSIEDEGKSVQFHLLFSYSGLRAWNVEINETAV